jgi:undecaprenyl-diphosphatase
MLAAATLPAAVAGVVGEDAVETHLREAPVIVAGLLIVFGLVLWLAEWRGRKVRELGETGWADGCLIGLAQALSLAPGVSRSGITITVGLARGMTREAAARFSFLLSIPIIGGAALYGLQDLARGSETLPEGGTGVLAAGFAAAAVSGYLCIRYFLRYLQRHDFAPFVIYRIAVGAFLMFWFASGMG